MPRRGGGARRRRPAAHGVVRRLLPSDRRGDPGDRHVPAGDAVAAEPARREGDRRRRRHRDAARRRQRGRRCARRAPRRSAVHRGQALARTEGGPDMKLVNEFEVAAPLERTWPLLLDVPRVGRALPGASIEPAGGDRGYRGALEMKLGALPAPYAGTARLEEVDEDARVARFEVQGREASGQGTAAATIVSRLRAAGEATRVVVETDLRVTGRQAQIGGTLMEDVAAAVLDRFAQALERELRGETPDADGGEDAFAVGGVMAKALAGRAALVAAGAAIGMVTGLAIGRWRWGSR